MKKYLEITKALLIFVSMITELDKVRQKRDLLRGKLNKIIIPERIVKYVYYDVAKELLISNETVKNYHLRGKIADGYLGEAILKLMLQKSKNLKQYLNP